MCSFLAPKASVARMVKTFVYDATAPKAIFCEAATICSFKPELAEGKEIVPNLTSFVGKVK